MNAPADHIIDSTKEKEAAINWKLWGRWALLFLPVAYLWFRSIDGLISEWSTNPQYSYGWVVPFLCLGLLMRRWQSLSDPGNQPRANRNLFQLSAFSVSAFGVFFAFLYLPTRLIEAATPEWRPIQWLLGFEAIGLTLCAIYMAKGPYKAWALAFPICFFLVAIPWPTLIEIPLIQSLTRLSSAMAVEVLGWIGIPAIQHGNIIEVSTGTVGVDEACSGIRSFQTSLMISLFFGEFYRMRLARRLLLVPAGFLLAILFNVSRVTILTIVAAKKGVAAIATYHDPAGIAITLICTVGLWVLALVIRGREVEAAPPVNSSFASGAIANHFNYKTLRRWAVALCVWLVVVEGGVEAWYRIRESNLKSGPSWTLAFPMDNATLRMLPIDAKTENLLRFDTGEQAAWNNPDGSQWQAFFCTWNPGRIAGYLAKRHTPDICMPAVGCTLTDGPKLAVVTIHGVVLPIRCYVFKEGNTQLNVFHCRWEAGAGEDAYVANESARYNLVRGIWAGRGNHGQKVLELVATGYADEAQAEAECVRQLEKMIIVGASASPAQAPRLSLSTNSPVNDRN